MSTELPPPAEPAALPEAVAAAPPVAIDPICKMKVNREAPKGGTHSFLGTTYYFCNPKCRDRFTADPARYLDFETKERAAQAEMDARPTFTLEEVQRQMARTATVASPFDRSFVALATYMRGIGAVREVPAPRTAITDDVLRRLIADATLRALASSP